MEICCSGTTILAIDEWIHNHSEEIRITRIALEILGAVAATYACMAFEAIYIPLVAAGFALLIITEITYQVLSFSGVFKTDPTNHIYPSSMKSLS